ncbi:carbohydrate kinase family protein [Allorhizocola rhizosphaerae]|uniref:carbohydrate kinase family protein n=1 Tax=Allorhizocola rhizosphaerae TaxID=1872709 RepID=UPI0013C2AF61|nr:carbohydrate kinase family protein [Allorhizocola rhizosphaerae]
MGTDLACFGYLAYAQVTAVAAYPAANSGAQVDQVFPSLAGDAPLCALTARRLGVSAHLISNRVSLDPAGQAVLDALDTAGVTHHAVPTETGGLGTPQLTIITDQAGTRTWFAWLGNAVDQLATVDLTPLTAARLAYIDCYRLMDSAAAAAITASRAPLLLNLGGDPLSDAIANAAAQRHIAFVQTNLDEHAADHAETLAAQLFDRLNPEAVVITLGRLGALGHTATATFRTSAPQVPVRHTHGAGAAFSGGLAHAYLTGATAWQAIHAACLVGTAHCATTTVHIPRQRLDSQPIKETQP